jgi:hypothetical protein
MVHTFYHENTINQLDCKMNGLFSLEITVSNIKNLGHHAWSLLKVIKFNIKFKAYSKIELSDLICKVLN